MVSGATEVNSNTSYSAFAKLNLQLHVTGQEKDGMHILDMVNVQISLHDDLWIEIGPKRKNSIYIITSSNFFTPPKKNLLYKAWEWYTSKTGIPISVTIRLRKRIPVGSGMGGGSSDAATLLQVLNNYFHGFKKEEFIHHSIEVGSDVAYFLVGGLCRIQGKGQYIQPIPENPELQEGYTLVCFPRKNVSTKKVYALYDQKELSYSKGLSDSPVLFPPHNDLLIPAMEIQPRISQCLAIINSTNPEYHGMSGSGSACFGLYSSQETCMKATDFMKRKGYLAWHVKVKQKNNL
jgi:4-diphosphocytidyl-2-C-methyl-D-erythritol kinase